MKHCVQYAFVGMNVCYDTENLSDSEIRAKMDSKLLGTPGGRIERFDRCPVCEEWTRLNGKMRRIDCPAVKAKVKR